MTTFSSFRRVPGLAPLPFAPTRLPSAAYRRSPPRRGQTDAPSMDVRMSFDVTASTDYCTSLRQRFIRLAGHVQVVAGRTHCSADVRTDAVRHECVIRHVRKSFISKEMVTDQ